MVIQHNLSAINSNRQFGMTTNFRAKSSEKLASGYKVNRAADDAAGLAISEKMRKQIRGLDQATNNVQDGISYVQVADGALAEIDDILARMEELCVKASTETLTKKDRAYIDSEIQKLKLESNRTFQTTTFNDKLIWDENTTARKKVGTEYRALISLGDTSSDKSTITEKNKGAWPIEGFKFTVSDGDTKVKVTWKGYDGVNYETSAFTIPDLETLKAEGLSLPVSSTTVSSENFPNAEGIEPVFTLTVDEETTREEFIKALKEMTITTSRSYTLNPTIKMDPTYTPTDKVTLSVSGSINYHAGLVSGKSLTANPDNTHIKTDPETGTNAGNNKSAVDTFDFLFTKATDTQPEGGNFKASAKFDTTSSTSIHVWSDDRSPAAQGVWWQRNPDNNDVYGLHYYYGGSNYSTALTNAFNGTESAKVITNNSGVGHMTISYNLKAVDNVNYSYEKTDGSRINGGTLTDMGNFNIAVTIQPGATQADVTGALNAIQGISFTSSPNTDMNINYNNSYYWGPVYGGTMALDIQAGANETEDDIIPLVYDVLNNHSLKISDLNTLTVDSAKAGLSKIKAAAETVDSQRAQFGAYQNRMEHTYKNLGNAVENTQHAESVIRDTDMAKEMVRNSNLNILSQAGQSILAQANQTTQGVMSLLQ